jgi:DNA-binding protein H-NS
MAKVNPSSMSVDALLQLRDDVERALTRKADELQKQLAALGKDIGGRGRRRGPVSAVKGRKVSPKYRGPSGETWAGRGAMPRWMAAAIKEGKKREDFLIDKSAATAKRSARKRGSVKKRRGKK